VVNLDVLVVVRLGAAGFATDVAGERSRLVVDAHMLFQVVAAMEGLVADVAPVGLALLVLVHVSNAVVLADELAAAVVAGVGPHVPVGAHVRSEVGPPVEGALAHAALERLRGAARVGPAMQLEVPFRREALAADVARIRSSTAMGLQHTQGNQFLHLARH